MDLITQSLLLSILLGAFFVEATIGFGATVIAVALGAMLVPIESVLTVIVPLNIVLSTYLVTRHRRAVNLRLLLRGILPAMALGLPLGLAILRAGSDDTLKIMFGAFVVVLSTLELARLVRARESAGRPLAAAPRHALLLAGGVIHGIYATGGPMAVYVAGRQIDDKRTFRSTLSALWLLLNLVLLVSYLAAGLYGPENTVLCLAGLPVLLLALVLGEWAHGRVPQRQFQMCVFILLMGAGGFLMITT